MSLIEEITSNNEVENLIDATESEVQHVKSCIQGFRYKIFNVKKVKNTFLEAMYKIKKAEVASRFERSPDEMTLIHVTGVDRANNIVKNNFDWRKVQRGRFGKGISFSDDATYADEYANRNIGVNRAIIVAYVLVTKSMDIPYANWNLEQLTDEFDTSTGNNRVYVKYYDHEMLPLYVAYYNQNEWQMNTYHTYNVMLPPPDFRMLQSRMFQSRMSSDIYYYGSRRSRLSSMRSPRRVSPAQASRRSETGAPVGVPIEKYMMAFTFLVALGLLLHKKITK